MTYDDKELFNQAMEDVRPLKQRASVVYLAAKSAPPQRPAPAPARQSQENFLITELFAPQPCDTPLYFKQDGIQQGLIDKLGHGKYLIEARLNITRMPVMRARALLFEFMERVTQEECRTLLIIHGRGPSDDSHANMVRSFVARWLTQFVQVQAYCCAQPAHGGAGACYVALRKSARAPRPTFTLGAPPVSAMMGILTAAPIGGPSSLCAINGPTVAQCLRNGRSNYHSIAVPFVAPLVGPIRFMN